MISERRVKLKAGRRKGCCLKSQCRQRGVGRLTLMVFVPLIAAVLFVAYHVMPFYYYYFELQEHMEQMVKVASIYPDKELKEKLRIHLKRMEIPAKIDQVKIERLAGHIEISLEYEEVFFVTWRGQEYDVHTFKFHAYAEGDY